jgi:hypothetical protein
MAVDQDAPAMKAGMSEIILKTADRDPGFE